MIGRLHFTKAGLRTDEDGNLELVLRVTPDSKYNARLVFEDLRTAAKEFTAVFDWRKRKRSLEQNRLLWALLEIMAKVQNGGRTGGIDARDCYLTMLERYGAKYEYFLCLPEALDSFKENFRAVKEVERRIYNGKEMVMCKCYYGSSKFNTEEMTALIDGVFDVLRDMDIDVGTSRDVACFYEDWQSQRRS